MLYFIPLGHGDPIAVTFGRLNKVTFSFSHRDTPARFCWLAQSRFLLGINVSLSGLINTMMWEHSTSLKQRIFKTYKHLQELQDQVTFLSLCFVTGQTALFTTFLTGSWAALVQETTCIIRPPHTKLLCCCQCPSVSSACSLLSRPARILSGDYDIHLSVN